MCKQVCIIGLEENFKVGQKLNSGRIGFFNSKEELEKKMPDMVRKRLKWFRVMSIDVDSKFVKENRSSNFLKPKSKASITSIVPLN